MRYRFQFIAQSGKPACRISRNSLKRCFCQTINWIAWLASFITIFKEIYQAYRYRTLIIERWLNSRIPGREFEINEWNSHELLQIIYLQYRSSWRKLFGKSTEKCMAESTINPTGSTSNHSVYCQIDFGKKSHKITSFFGKSRKVEEALEFQDQSIYEMSVMVPTDRSIINSIDDRTNNC